MTNSRNMNSIKRIAFVADDNEKTGLIEWSYFNKDLLKGHKITATGNAGNILEGTLNMPVQKLLSGPTGGYQQLAALIEEGKIDIIIFFWNAVDEQLEKSSVRALRRIALAANIIIACNRTTADFILTSALMNKDHLIAVPGNSIQTGQHEKPKKMAAL